MLSLFLAGGSIDWDEGKIKDVKVPTPTQEYKNILLQPPTICRIQAGNILLTVFTTAPDTIEARFSPLFSLQQIVDGVFPEESSHIVAECKFPKVKPGLAEL